MSSNTYWKLSFTSLADKFLEKIDKPIKKRLISFLEDRVLPTNNPRLFGKPLRGKLSGYWSYRVGDYRLIAHIKDEDLVILVVQLDHRRQVYDLL